MLEIGRGEDGRGVVCVCDLTPPQMPQGTARTWLAVTGVRGRGAKAWTGHKGQGLGA